MNYKKKKYGFMAVIAGLLLIVSATLANMSDRDKMTTRIKSPQFNITVDASTDATVLMPSKPTTFQYTVSSDTTLDADIRERVMIYGLNDVGYIPINKDNPQFNLQNFAKTDDLFEEKVIGNEAILYTNYRELKTNDTYIEKGIINLNPALDNTYADKTYVVSILIEAKQKKATEWQAIAYDTVDLGQEIFDDMSDVVNKVKAVDKGLDLYIKPSPMLTGKDFNKLIPDNTTNIVFKQNAPVPDNKKVIDVSTDGTVVAWVEDTNMIVVSTDGPVILAPDSIGMFKGKTKLTTVDFDNVDTSQVISMKDLFNGDTSLKTVENFDKLNTSNVTDFTSIFEGCKKLESVDVSNLDTANVTSLRNMFRNCSKINNLDVSNWDTSYVTEMDSVFGGCSVLEYVDVSYWDTSRVTNMDDLFCGCRKMKVLDVSNFDTRNVVTMRWMFCDMGSLEELDLTNFYTPKLTKMYKLFHNDYSLKVIYVSDYWDNSKALDESAAGKADENKTFTGCYRLKGAVPFTTSKQGPDMANYKTGYFTYREAIMPR